MKEIKKRVRKSGIIKSLILLMIALLFTSGYFILDVDFDALFNEPCVVDSIDDIEACTGKYTTLKFEEAYNVEYAFEVNGELAGSFVDFGLNDKILIGLVDKDEASALFHNTTDGATEIKELTGVLKEFTDENMITAFNSIFEKYLEKYTEITREELEQVFLPVQFDAYTDSLTNEYITFYTLTTLIGITILLFLVTVIKTLTVKVKYQKGINKDKIEEELLHGPYLYKGKNFILTYNHVVAIHKYSIKANKLDDLIWMYERVVKKIGSSSNEKFVIFNFKGKTNSKVKFKNEDIENVIRLSTFRNTDMLTGYSKENYSKWKNS